MSAHAATAGLPEPGEEESRDHSKDGPAPVRIVVAYGFWLFLLSDIIMFSALFASYAVLSGQTAGGPSGRELFELRHVGIETLCLLFSSYTCGLGILSVERRQAGISYVAFALTFALGATFLGLEVSEFVGLVARGAGPSRSAFLSAFSPSWVCTVCTLAPGCCGCASWWRNSPPRVPRDFLLRRRLLCFSLFWRARHVWVGLLTLVYLMGAR